MRPVAERQDRPATAPRRPAWLPMVLIVSLFFLWGVANNLNDVLVAHFRNAFSLTDLQSGLVQSAFYLGYFLFAFPAAAFAHKLGYKAAVVLGLGLYGLGALLFYPAAEARTYAFFLGALFVIASGLAFLETSANPLMTVLGPSEGAEQRLNLAQAFNPLGNITGVLIGRTFILSGVDLSPAALGAMTPAAVQGFRTEQAHAVEGPYLALGGFVLVWAFITALVRFPPEASRPSLQDQRRVSLGELRSLLARKRFLFGVAAQFCYVGAQVGVWSFMIRYTRVALPGTSDKAAAAYLTVSLVVFMIGRFAGTALMGKVRPARLLALFAAADVLLCLVAAFAPGRAGLTALIAVSFFMSIMYPTIFAGAISGMGRLTKLASSFVVMGIVGGAIFPAVMGRISDLSSIATAMLAPAVAFLAVCAFALSTPSPNRAALADAAGRIGG